MNTRDVERMPYGLVAILLLVVAPIGVLWSFGSSMAGFPGFLAGVLIGLLLILANNFVNGLMIRNGYRDEPERKPASIWKWGWLAIGVCTIGAIALYSDRTLFIGYLAILLVWGTAESWGRRKLSK